LAARDLTFIATTLHASEAAARAHRAAAWVFRGDGTAVPPELEAAVFDDGDGNGPRVLVDGYTRVVARRGHADEDSATGLQPPAPHFALDGFEEQKRRLRLRLQPLVDAGAKAGGSVGLEWLLESECRDNPAA